MVIVQGIKKGPQGETCADFANTFVQCINRITQGYSEGFLIVDTGNDIILGCGGHVTRCSVPGSTPALQMTLNIWEGIHGLSISLALQELNGAEAPLGIVGKGDRTVLLQPGVRYRELHCIVYLLRVGEAHEKARILDSGQNEAGNVHSNLKEPRPATRQNSHGPVKHQGGSHRLCDMLEKFYKSICDNLAMS